MKLVTFDYFEDFKCTASDCLHNCCIGWEIDVDEYTLDYYREQTGTFGQKLSDNIDTSENGGSFRLKPDGRCPFLNDKNLCEIILNLGEDALCQVCSDHPRFRSYFSDRAEIGLGLCCEAAGRSILGKVTPIRETVLGDDGENESLSALEKDIISARTEIVRLLQDRSFKAEDRAEKVLQYVKTDIPHISISEWMKVFLSLEQLDPEWGMILSELQDFGEHEFTLEELEIPFEQLMVYFIYRHLPDSSDSDDIAARAAFAVLGYKIIRALCTMKKCKTGSCTLEDLVEYSRMFSSEIEYSDENADKIIRMLKR